MERTEPIDPWERWSWLMGSIWLVFLVFPVSALVTSSDSVAARGVGLVAITLFAALYVGALASQGRHGRPWAYLSLALLTALSVLVVALVGADGLGMLIYVVAFALLSISLRLAALVVVAAAATMVAVPAAAGDLAESWFLVVIILLVAAALLIVRVLEDRGESFRALRDEVQLVEERERVARDVHDVLGHSLTVVTAKSELAERLIDLDPERAKRELAEIRSLTREALSEIRATVSGLRIARLGDELESARRALAAAGIEATVPHDPSPVDPRHRLTMAWVLREAVTNVVRHSAAGRCDVQLDPAALRVVDDGRGCEGASPGNGLQGVSERVRAAGGRLRVDAGPDGVGTLVEVTW